MKIVDNEIVKFNIGWRYKQIRTSGWREFFPTFLAGKRNTRKRRKLSNNSFIRPRIQLRACRDFHSNSFALLVTSTFFHSFMQKCSSLCFTTTLFMIIAMWFWMDSWFPQNWKFSTLTAGFRWNEILLVVRKETEFKDWPILEFWFWVFAKFSIVDF